MASKHVGGESGLSRSQFLTRSAAVAAGVGALGVVGCGDDDNSGSGSNNNGTPTGVLRVGIFGGSATDADLSPDVYGPSLNAILARNYAMYEPLFYTDVDSGELVMALAESAEPNSDATSWDVKLRDGVEFHNGKPVTPEDVIASFKRYAKPTSVYAVAVKTIDRVEKTGPQSVRFVLNTPNPRLTRDVGGNPAYGAITPTDFDPKNPIGAGAFSFVSHQPGRKLVLKANPNYWDGAPGVETLEFIEFAETDARVNALLAGQIDATDSIPGSQYQTVKARDGLKTVVSPTDQATCIGMNMSKAPFDDVRVRQAFMLIVDRPAMLQQALAGLGVPGNDVLAKFDPATPDLPQREQDIEQARSLLAAAGQSDLEVELATSDISGSAVAISEVFAEQAKAAGVTVKIKKIPAAEYYLPQSGYREHSFFVSAATGSDYVWIADLILGPEAPFAETFYKNERHAQLLKDVRKETDPEKQAEIVGEMMTIDHEEGTYIVPAFDQNVTAFSDKVEGFKETKGSYGMNDYRFNEITVKS